MTNECSKHVTQPWQPTGIWTGPNQRKCPYCEIERLGDILHQIENSTEGELAGHLAKEALESYSAHEPIVPLGPDLSPIDVEDKP